MTPRRARIALAVLATLATLGLFAGLFVPRRRIWVKASLTAEGVHVEYAGLARGEDPALAHAVADIAGHHLRTYSASGANTGQSR